MTEISFARSFLSALDGRPIKVASDHISDPRQLPSQVGYTLPKYPSTPAKRKRDAADDDTASAAPASASGPSTTSGAAAGLTVKLSNMKTPTASLALAQQASSASVFDLKQAYAAQWSVPVDKIKLLYAKKPVADSKTLGEVVGAETDVEFGVMLLGGVVPSEKREEEQQEEKPKAAVGPSGKELLATDAFWTDLKGFLVQRLKDESEGERLAQLFRKAVS